MNWLWINQIRNWWSDNHTVSNGIRIIRRIGNNIFRLMLIVILIDYFYTAFPERFQTIYGWFDEWLQFGEFSIRTTIQLMFPPFTSQSIEFWAEYNEAVFNWLSTLHF